METCMTFPDLFTFYSPISMSILVDFVAEEVVVKINDIIQMTYAHDPTSGMLCYEGGNA